MIKQAKGGIIFSILMPQSGKRQQSLGIETRCQNVTAKLFLEQTFALTFQPIKYNYDHFKRRH